MPFACGQITSPTSGGTPQDQSVTGLTFKPKAVIFFTGRSIVNDVSAGANMNMGWAVDGTNQRSWGWTADDAAGTSNLSRSYSTNAMTVMQSGGGAVDAVFNFKQFNSDGFTITWTDLSTVNMGIWYMAIGGVGTQVSVDEHTMQAGTGNKGYTGVGFQPDLVLFGTTQQTSAAQTTSCLFSFGAAKSSTERWALGVAGLDGATMSSTVNCQKTHSITRCLIGLSTASAINLAADFVSMDTDGFTINQVTNPGTILFTTLSIKGFSNLELGVFTKPTTDGGTNQPTTAFTPEGYIFAGIEHTNTFNTVESGACSVVGFSAGSNQGVGWVCSRDVITSDANKAYKNNRAYVSAANTNPAATETEASLSGTTLTWTPNTTEANQVFYISFITPDRIAATERVLLKDGSTSQSKATNLTVYEQVKIAELLNKAYTKNLVEIAKLIETKSILYTPGTDDKSLVEIVLLRDIVNKQISKALKDIVLLKEPPFRSSIDYTNVVNEIALLKEKTPALSFEYTIIENETIYLVEAKSIAAKLLRSNTDLVFLSEKFTTFINRNLLDIVLLSESARLGKAKNLFEQILLRDTVLKQFAHSVNETVKLSESKIYSLGKNVTEVVKLSEAISKTVVYARSINEIVKLIETITKTFVSQGSFNLSINEIVKLSESVRLLASYTKNLAEQVILRDVISKQLSHLTNDIVKLNDTINKGLAHLVAEKINIADLLTLSANIGKSATEIIVISDRLYRSVAKSISDRAILKELKNIQLFVPGASVVQQSDIVLLADQFSYEKSTAGLGLTDKVLLRELLAKTFSGDTLIIMVGSIEEFNALTADIEEF